MAKVFTLTCNLLAQHSLDFAAVKPGAVNRAKRGEFCVGGKGVNVAAALLKMGVGACAVIFSGGKTGERCEEFLAKKGVEFLAVKTECETRSGFVCRAENCETSFFEPDAFLSDGDFENACSLIERRAEEGDILAFCGSAPNWSAGKFAALKSLLKIKNLRFVCDTYGAPLKDLFFEKSEILKINSGEFFAFSNKNLEEGFGEFECKTPSKFFAVTGGENSAFARTGKAVKKFEPRKIGGAAYPTGCGDALLASLVKCLAKNGECSFEDFKSAMDFATKQAETPSIYGL